jgi:hypothetical protein
MSSNIGDVDLVLVDLRLMPFQLHMVVEVHLAFNARPSVRLDPLSISLHLRHQLFHREQIKWKVIQRGIQNCGDVDRLYVDDGILSCFAVFQADIRQSLTSTSCCRILLRQIQEILTGNGRSEQIALERSHTKLVNFGINSN